MSNYDNDSTADNAFANAANEIAWNVKAELEDLLQECSAANLNGDFDEEALNWFIGAARDLFQKREFAYALVDCCSDAADEIALVDDSDAYTDE